MTSKVARCYERSQELPILLMRGVLWSAGKSPGCLLLFGLQMAQRWVRGQSDNHICKQTSPLEQYFGGPTSWPCCFCQVNVCNASTYGPRCVSMKLSTALCLLGSGFQRKKSWDKMMRHSTLENTHICKQHTQRLYTHSTLINSFSPSWVCEASPP